MKLIIAFAFLAVASAIPRSAVLSPPALPKIEKMEMINIQLPELEMPSIDVSKDGVAVKFEKLSLFDAPVENDDEILPSFRNKRSIDEDRVQVADSPVFEEMKPAKTMRAVESDDGVISFVAVDESHDTVQVAENAVEQSAPVKTMRAVESADGVISFVPIETQDEVKVADVATNEVSSPVKKIRAVESEDGIISFIEVENLHESINIADLELAVEEAPVKTMRAVESADGVISFEPIDEQDTVKVAESAPTKNIRVVESADGVISFVEDSLDTVQVVEAPVYREVPGDVRVVESADGVISFEVIGKSADQVINVPIQMRPAKHYNNPLLRSH